MYKGKEIVAFADKNKSIIWGLFLSTIIFKYAIGSIFLGILLVLFLIQLYQNEKIVFNKSLLPIAIFFLWGAVSLFWTTNISSTIKGIGSTSPLILIPLLISQYPDFEINDLRKTTNVFGICLILYLLICCINAGSLFLGDKQFGHFFYHNLVSVFENNAIYISLAVAITILISFNLPKKTTKDYVIILFLGLFLLLLSSKNIIITTSLLVLLSLIINKHKFKAFFAITFILCIIGLVIAITDNPVKDRFLAELNLNIPHIWYGQDFYNYKFSGIEIRLFQWRLIGEMIGSGQVGILGLGLNNVNYLLEQYFSYYNLYKGYFFINFHNQFLQTLSELGFIGLLLLLWVFLKSIYKAFKSKNKYEILFIILFMTAFFTESFLCRQKGIFLFATVYGLIFKISKKRIERKN